MPGSRKILPHIPPAFVPDGSWFFITICCQARGVNQLCILETASRLIEDATHYHRQGTWFLHTFLLMPDHLHMIAAFPRDKVIAAVVRNWKRLTARSAGIEWQKNFFDHRLRSKDELQAKTDYIQQNPIRLGLVQHADDWPHFVDYRALEGR